MLDFLKNLKNLLPAIIGTFQLALPILKELIVDIIRLIAILPFLWDVDQPLIDKVNSIYTKVYAWVETIKNVILAV